MGKSVSNLGEVRSVIPKDLPIRRITGQAPGRVRGTGPRWRGIRQGISAVAVGHVRRCLKRGKLVRARSVGAEVEQGRLFQPGQHVKEYGANRRVVGTGGIAAIHGRRGLVRIVNLMNRQTQLAQVVLGLRTAGCITGHLHRRQQQRDQDANDGDDD